MAIEVKFYVFSKKENSTARPQNTIGGGTEYITTFNCRLKEDCRMISPILTIDGGGTFNPAYIPVIGKTLNYAFIADFGNRYYFIDEWTYSADGYWVASLRLDVLASWKNSIGATTAYVLRSSSEYDGDIIDTMYPTYGADIVSQNSGSLFSSGYYIVGTYGKNPNTLARGAVSYYSFTEAELSAFCDWLWSNDLYNAIADDDLNVKKSAIDPIKYIASVMYIPLTNFGRASIGIMSLGWWNSATQAHPTGLFPVSNIVNMTATDTTEITIPKHPQAATRGNYLNYAPYSRYVLHTGPWGDIPLDSTDLYNISKIKLEVSCDLLTGMAELRVLSGTKTLERAVGQVGVPIPMAQIQQSLVSAGSSVITSAADFVSKYTGENAITKAISNIGDAVTAATTNLQTAGSIGSTVNLIDPILTGRFLNVVDANDDHRGRPLCKEKLISTLSGYVQVLDGDLNIPASATELESLKTYLENGFFYE